MPSRSRSRSRSRSPTSPSSPSYKLYLLRRAMSNARRSPSKVNPDDPFSPPFFPVASNFSEPVYRPASIQQGVGRPFLRRGAGRLASHRIYGTNRTNRTK